MSIASSLHNAFRQLVVIVLLLLPAGLCLAQRRVTVYVAGGTGSLMDPSILRRHFGLAYGGAFGVGMPVSRLFEAVAFAEFQRMPQEENTIRIAQPGDGPETEFTDVPTTGGELDRSSVSLGVRSLAPIESSLRPYAFATGGWYRVRNHSVRFVHPDTDTEFISDGANLSGWGVNLGLGAGYVLTPFFRLLAEAGYVRVFDDTERSYWSFRLGAGVSPWGKK